MKYELTAPCGNCPFRNDGNGLPLRKGRVAEITRGLVRGEFPCHKTVNYDDVNEDGIVPDDEQQQHCAGALIFLEKLDKPSQMMRICERIGIYDRAKLNMGAPVYGSVEEMTGKSI